MRRLLILAVVLSLVPGAAVARAAEAQAERAKEAPHYESPVLSLILLPFNILIRMASVFEPETGSKTPNPGDSKR